MEILNERMCLRLFLVILALIIIKTSGSALHGQCFNDDDCGTIDTFCNDGICSCKKNFVVWFDSCIQITTPAVHCRKKDECHKILGARSLCSRNNVCACRPFHHLHNRQCVKNRDLHDICEQDHQCYCGVDCGDKIACIGRNCTCKPGHKAYRSRRCILTEPLKAIVVNGANQINQGFVNLLTIFLITRLLM